MSAPDYHKKDGNQMTTANQAESMDYRIGRLEGQLGQVVGRLDRIEDRLDKLIFMLFGTGLTFGAGLAVLIVKAFVG
jgi:hypothetical protein